MNLLDVQAETKAMGLYSAAVDGIYGPRTDDAVEALLENQRIEGHEAWPNSRQQIAAQQVLVRMRGIEVGKIDGRMGPLSAHAFEVYDARKKAGWQKVAEIEAWRDSPQPVVAPSRPRPMSSTLAPPAHVVWPKQSRVESVFGTPGQASKQTSLVFPFPMRLAWDLDSTVRKASCHVLCRESFEFIWKSTLDHYGVDEIRRLRLDLYGGILNVRRMRGGSSWSMHAWGIAQDVDPEHNALKMKRAQATLDGPEYDPFWKIVLATGATSLGIKHDFDWMHFQFADT